MDVIPDSLVSELSSLTTPYGRVITEDAVAGDDQAGRLYNPSGGNELAPLDDSGRAA